MLFRSDKRGSSYSHRRQLVRCFSNCRKGLRSFIEGNIEGSSRDYDLLIEGILLKHVTLEGHDYLYPRQQVWVTLEVHVCKVCWIQLFYLGLGLSNV